MVTQVFSPSKLLQRVNQNRNCRKVEKTKGPAVLWEIFLRNLPELGSKLPMTSLWGMVKIVRQIKLFLCFVIMFTLQI